MSAARGGSWLTLVIVGLGVMMTDLNLTIVAVANPVLQQQLGATLDQVQWVTTAYLLALAMALIPAGALGDRWGHRRVFLAGTAAFALSSAAITVAGGAVEAVIALRVLQGLGGALIMPTALALLRVAFPRERLSVAIGVYGMVIAASTAAGPLVGGLLVEHLDWRAVFAVNLPIGAVVLALGFLGLARTRPERAGGFDVPGIALLSGGMLCVIWALTRAGELRGPDPAVWGLAVGAVVIIGLFILVESRVREPVLPLRLFASRSLSAGVLLVALMAFALIGGTFFITFYLQNVLGLGPADSGLRLLPLTGVMIVASPLAGRLIARLGPRAPMAVGMVLTAASAFGLTTLTADSGVTATSAWFALLGVGLSPVVVGATGVIVGGAPADLTGVAGGVHQSALQIGGGLGTALLGALVSARVGVELPGNWAAAGLPPLEGAEHETAIEAVTVGAEPRFGDDAAAVAEVTRETFLSGIGLAFTVACAIAAIGALVSYWVKPGAEAPD